MQQVLSNSAARTLASPKGTFDVPGRPNGYRRITLLGSGVHGMDDGSNVELNFISNLDSGLEFDFDYGYVNPEVLDFMADAESEIADLWRALEGLDFPPAPDFPTPPPWPDPPDWPPAPPTSNPTPGPPGPAGAQGERGPRGYTGSGSELYYHAGDALDLSGTTFNVLYDTDFGLELSGNELRVRAGAEGSIDFVSGGLVARVIS